MFTSVIVPAYNEEDRIKATLDSLLKVEDINEIIVVDDCSTDRTFELVQEYKDEKIILKKQEVNSGKGGAIEAGLKLVDKDSDIIVFLDADLGSTAGEVEKLIQPFKTSDVDMTVAQFAKAKKKGGFGLVKNLAYNSILELTGNECTYSLSGQRAFKKEIIERFGGKMPVGYGVEVGMLVDIMRWGYKVQGVPVTMTHNETGRNLKGFLHRGKQFIEIKKVVKQKKNQWGKWEEER